MATKGIPISKAAPIALPELEVFLRPYADLFKREPTRRSVERYLTGLFTDLSHKTCDTIAQAVAGTSTQRLHHMLTDAEWDSGALDETRARRLAAESPEAGILILDDTGQVKQGRCSVGVARQYSGTMGKVGNCQVIVTAQYMADQLHSSSPLHWPVAARLYLPKTWATDTERRRKAHVPEDMTFQKKPQIALDLVKRARDWGVPFRYVVADAGYGDSTTFLAGLEGHKEPEVLYICGVESTFGVRKPEEVQVAEAAPPPEYQGNGRPRLPRPAPLYKAKDIADSLPDKAWQTVTWREGTKGSLSKEFAAVRMHWGKGNPALERPKVSSMATGPEGWLLMERPLPSEDGDRKYYYSNLPAETPLERLVALAHARWVIEQFYREAKGECGFDNYQGRSWHGLHRHLALSMLSYTFLVQQRARDSQMPEGGFSPLRLRAHPARRTQGGLGLAAERLTALASSDQFDLALQTNEKLTK